ncbi:MAG: carboxypeptidase regulatory-like domain-containing protein [Terriglobales bacterium]|jgi:hypothetical protein
MKRSTVCPFCRLSIFGLILLFLCTISARADVNGAVVGTVADASGAVVAGVTVSLTNSGNGFARQTTTAKDGTYEFLEVPIGEGYAVTAEMAGFRKAEQTGIRLLVNQRLRVDFTLQVGKASEQLTVEANTVQVETSVTQLGEVIEDKKILSMPLNGRSYIDLLGLQAGVSPISATANEPSGYANGSGSNSSDAGNVSVNGQRENANGFMVNGGSVEDTSGNGANIIPVLDSIQEFRLLTNSFDAEYGHFSGALVNVITKSGSNAIHGTGFEFLRNTALDANDYFNAGNPVSVFRQNQFGGVIGGPIIKNRLFFFGDYQGTHTAHAIPGSEVGVMSTPERSGNFSDQASSLTGTVPGSGDPGDFASVLTTRLGYAVTAGEALYSPSCTTTAECVFPGAMIPQIAWSPAALGTLKFVPSPNSGSDLFTENGFLTTTVENKFGARIDLNTKSTGNWTWYYNFTNSSQDNPGLNGNPNFPYTRPFRAQQGNFSNTLLIGPNMVNEFRINATRSKNPGNYATGGLGKVSSFGFVEGGQGIIPSRPAIEGVPLMSFSSGLSLGAAIQDGNYQTAFQFSDAFSKTWGRHTFKFGGAFGYAEWARRGGPDPNGVFTIDGGQSGNQFVDYLLGIPSGFTQSSAQSLDARSKNTDLFAQDSFRLSPNLTLNYGLRWEVSEPWYDTKGRIQAFVPGQQSTVYANSPTGWLFPGDKGIPKTLAPTRWNNFAPRFGLAYAPSASGGLLRTILGGTGQTSIRAGAGIFYTDFDTSGQAFAMGDAPFGLFVNGASHPYFEQPYTNYSTGANNLQPFPWVPPTGADTNFAPFQPIAFSPAFNTHNKLPYSINYHLTWQRELWRSTIFSVGYVGTMGRHLYQQMANNLGNPQLCQQIKALYVAAGQPNGGCGPAGEDSIYSIDGQTFNGTRQYSVTSGKYLSQGLLDFGDNSYESTIGTSSYNSLQVSLNRSVGAFHFLAAYTFGKAMDYGSGFYDLTNPYNIKLSKGLSQFDITHNFVASYSYDLPFTRLLPHQSGVAAKALGGWQIAGTTRFTTGVPITFTDSSNAYDTSLCGCDLFGILGFNAVDLPNYNGAPVKIFNPREHGGQYFDTTPFSEPAIGTAGNARRRFLHGPGLNNTDIALIKTTRVSERVGIDFRMEFFNLFNHAQFVTPSGDINGLFGLVTAAQPARIGQAAIKINF